MSDRSIAEVEHTEKMMREARLAERERCAKLLDDRAQEYNRQRDPGMANHCRMIAREIRTQ